MKKSKFVAFLLMFCLLSAIIPPASAGPIITGNLSSATYLQGEAATPLSYGLFIIGTTFEWQSYTGIGWLSLLNETGSSYTPPTDTIGTKSYRCKTVKDSIVSYTGTIKITVLRKPILSLSPASQTVIAGSTASFAATASNTDGWELTHSYWAWGPSSNSAEITGDYSANGSIALTSFSKVINSVGSVYYFYVGEYLDSANSTKNIKIFSNGAQVIVNSPPAVNPFTDVLITDWFYSNVLDAYQKGLVNGTTSSTYSPNSNLTISSAIKLSACMHQYYSDGAITLVQGTVNWYDTYVDYAIAHGIISSSTYAGRYDDYATRAEYVKIFYYALPSSEYTQIQNVTVGKIPDVSITDAFGYEVYTFYRAGILCGNDAIGSFSPASNIKRSEVGAIISRMITPSNRLFTPYSWLE